MNIAAQTRVCFLLFALAPLAWIAGEIDAAERPNIIIVLVDDMGFSDVGCYGGEIDTPSIDLLASNGLRFTQFYNSGRCCPTRASLMTGLHPHQVGIGHMTEPPGQPLGFEGPYQGYLNNQCVTIAQVLRSAGYRTLMTGKWHLGYERQDTWPLQRGFDRYFGCLSGACNYFKPGGNRGITLGNSPVSTDESFYATDSFTDYACKFISESVQQDADKPFFLYLAYNAPHWPLNSKWEEFLKYKGKYTGGWEQLMKRRLAKQKAIGLFPNEIVPAPHVGPQWESLSDKQHDDLDSIMAAYAGCIDSIDQNIGKLTDHLRGLGQIDNTVIFFLSDNGACQEGGVLGKGSREMVKNPPLETTGGVRLGLAWANACNTPLRLYKHYVHEGGACTPLIVQWPAGIPKRVNGSFVRQYAYLPDFMATCMELAGAPYPSDVPPCEGVSMTSLFEGNSEPIHVEPIFWEHEGNAAVRSGKWKLVREYQKPWELYDMEIDRAELNDLSEKHVEKRDELIGLWTIWATNYKVAFPERFNMYEFLNRKNKTQKKSAKTKAKSKRGQKSPRPKSHPATVLLITAQSLADAWEPYASWKTQLGKRTKIVTVEAIDRQYQADCIQEKIRLCVRDHVDNYQTRWIVLGGDCLAGGKGLVPGGHTTIHTQEKNGIPTDIVYLSPTNWDADRDGVFGEWEDDRGAITYPDGSVGLGRVPVRSANDVAAFTDKVLAYEAHYPTSGFATQMVYTCTEPHAYPKVRNSWDGYVADAWEMGTVQRFFAHESPWDKGGQPGSHQLSADNLVALFNGKVASKLHIHGHGHLPMWCLEGSNFAAEHVEQLTHDKAYPLITTVCCFTGQFDGVKDPSIVESMIRQPRGGAVAVVAPVRAGKPHFHTPSDFRLMLTEGKLDGTTLAISQYWVNGLGKGLTTGESLMKAKAAMASDAGKSASFHLCICELNLLGDPTLDMRAGNPRNPQIVLPEAIDRGRQSVVVSTDTPKGTICLWKENEVYCVATADRDGKATVSIAPATAGEIVVTVSGADLNAASKTITVK